MSTLVNLLLAIVLNILGVQVQERVQENKTTEIQEINIISEEKISECTKVDSIYDVTQEVKP